MKLNFFLILSVFSFIVSCKDKIDSEKASLVDISIPKAYENEREDVALSFTARYINYIQLETTEESLLSGVDDIELIDSSLFVFNDRQLMEFNLQGKYIRSIGKRGQGPGEFNKISDIAVDSSERTIAVLDGDLRKILFFDLSGDYQDEMRLINISMV